MRPSSLNGVLVPLALAASLLVAACGADATPTLLPTTDVDLERNNFAADLPISTTAYLYDFLMGESIDVSLVASNGTAASLGTAEANRGGLASIDFRHDGLSEGQYQIVALGDQGSKTSTVFIVK